MKTKKKTNEIKGIIFGVCKTNNKEIWQNKSGFAHEIHVSWLYYGDIKIRDTFVYKHILLMDISHLDHTSTTFGVNFDCFLRKLHHNSSSNTNLSLSLSLSLSQDPSQFKLLSSSTPVATFIVELTSANVARY